MKSKTKKIIFRVDESLYKFIEHFSKTTGNTISDTCRNVLIYFHIGLLQGEFTKSLKEMEENFMKLKTPSRKQYIENIRKILE